MRIEYHRTLIADRIRNDAFHAALKSAIKPGQSVVCDIGAGTGLLGLMAAKLGAKQVFMFETAAVAGVAAKTIKANRAKQCVLIPCHSTEFDDDIAAAIMAHPMCAQQILGPDSEHTGVAALKWMCVDPGPLPRLGRWTRPGY